MLIQGKEIPRPYVQHHTVTDTIPKADADTIHTNRGAPGMIRLRLPLSAPRGLTFTFCVNEEYELNVDPQTNKIYGSNDAVEDKYYHTDVIGSSITVCADENEDWLVIATSGTWTREA